jgi:hypothetical protein
MRKLLAGFLLGGLAVTAWTQDVNIEIAFSRLEGWPYYKNERQPKPGPYFSLQPSEHGFSLIRTNIKSKPTIVRGYDHDGPGNLIQCDSKNSIILIRGIQGLKEGDVKTWYWNGFSSSNSKFKTNRSFYKKINCDGETYTIKGEWRTPDSSSGDGEGLQWKMQTGRQSWNLDLVSSWYLGRDEVLAVEDYLVWVGDIDGDGKPDFLVRPQGRHESFHQYLELSLFLSSHRKARAPWKPASRFYFWDPKLAGC